MHPSSHAALALLLLSAQPAAAQAPLPPGFTDAAAVVDGLIVDMRYFGANNFVGERIDGYERPRCLLSVPAANALAAVERDLAARGLGLKVFDCYRPQPRSRNSCAGRSGSTTSSANVNSTRTWTSATCSRRVTFRSFRPFARLDPRSHAGAARGRPRARYGLAVRLLQPEIMAVGSKRERSGAREPRAAVGSSRRL